MINECTGLKVSEATGTSIRVSGSLESHYAPKATVVLDQIPKTGEGYIALETHETPLGVIRLAAPRNDEEFAQCLYAALHEADIRQIETVVVKQPKGEGISIAIRDRLKRASK
jgi:L-threonylcarbamoyladenylate synthase